MNWFENLGETVLMATILLLFKDSESMHVYNHYLILIRWGINSYTLVHIFYLNTQNDVK